MRKHEPTCVCLACYMDQHPAPRPSINPTKPIGYDLELAQDIALLIGLGEYERKVARAHMKALRDLQKQVLA